MGCTNYKSIIALGEFPNHLRPSSDQGQVTQHYYGDSLACSQVASGMRLLWRMHIKMCRGSAHDVTTVLGQRMPG